MFVYEKNGVINVTFKDNKPVENPEYVVEIDKENEKLIVNEVELASAAKDEVIEEVPAEEEIKIPVVDDTTESDVDSLPEEDFAEEDVEEVE